MLVSSEFKAQCKDINAVFNHSIEIINETKNQNIGQYVELQTFKLRMEKTGLFGLVSANSLTFTMKLPTGVNPASIIAPGDTIVLKDSFSPLTSTSVLSLFGLTERAKYESTTNEPLTLFTGIAQAYPTEITNSANSYEITVYDMIKNGIEKKFDDHEVRINWYVCNNSATENSLAHYLAQKAGIPADKLLFEDVKDANGDYIVIPYAHFEKGNSVMQEFAELAESVKGAIYVNNAGQLVFQTPFNNEDYNDIEFTFDTNILEKITIQDIEAEGDKVTLTYDVFHQADRQVCWMFYDKNSYDAAADRANMRLKAGQTSAWIKVDWVTPIALDIETTPEIIVEDGAGNDMSSYFNYELDVDITGGKVRFHNLSQDTDIYIQRFKLYGKPLEKLAGNEMSYTEVAEPVNPITLENKFVQSSNHAEMVVKYEYHQNCKPYKIYNFKCIYAPFLAINDLVTINCMGIDEQVIITGVTHQADGNMPVTEVEAISYRPYQFTGTVEAIEAGPDVAKDLVEFDKPSRDEVLASEGLPVPHPKNIQATSSFKHIWIEWNVVERNDLLGYNIYIKDITDPNTPVQKRFFSKSNSFIYQTSNDKTYEVQVSTVTLAGESEMSDIVTISTPSGIDWEEVQNAAIDTEDLVDRAVTSAKIALQAINTALIDDAAITNAKIADLAVTAAKIAEAAIATAHIKDAAITNAKIADLAVDAAKIADAAITKAKIADAAITTAKIADAAVDSAKIADAAITTAKIEDLAVTDAKIKSIQAAKLMVGDKAAQIVNPKPEGGYLWHFDQSVISTDGIQPLPGAVYTLRPNEGKFSGAVAVEEGTTNLVNNPTNWVVHSHTSYQESVNTGERFLGCRVTKTTKLSTGSPPTQIGEDLSIANGETYTASVYVKITQKGNLDGARLTFYDSNNSQVLVQTFSTKVGEWERLEVTYKNNTGSTLDNVRVYYYPSRDTGDITYTAAPQLEQKPFATSFVDGTREDGILIYNHGDLPEATISFWAKCNPEAEHVNAWANLLDWANRDNTSRFYIEVYNGYFRWAGFHDEVAPYDQEWHMHTITRESDGTFHIYFDGEELATSVFPGTIPAKAYIGCSWVAAQQVNILFDELLIIPYAATKEEIQQWYNSQSPFYDHSAVFAVTGPKGMVLIDSSGQQFIRKDGIKTIEISTETGNAFFRGQVLGAVYNE